MRKFNIILLLFSLFLLASSAAVQSAHLVSYFPIVTETGPTTFPIIKDIQTGNSSSATSAHSVQLPSSINVGDGFIVAIMGKDAGTISTPSNWVKLGERIEGSDSVFAVFALDATGNEGGMGVTFSSASASTSAHIILHIVDWGGSIVSDIDIASFGFTSGTTSPDPPSITAGWGLDTNLFVSFVAATDDDATFTSAPANYLNLTQQVTGGGTDNGGEIAIATRHYESASDDPSAFQLSESEFAMFTTLVIKPGHSGSGSFIQIPQTGWTVEYVDSEETVDETAPATYAIDGNTSTYWHSDWNPQDPLPHEIQIDMGREHKIDSFSYMPRQDSEDNGRIANYEFYVSNDTANWGTAVATGTFADTEAEKTVALSSPKIGRYFRLVALSEVNNQDLTAAAELNVTEGDGEGEPGGDEGGGGGEPSDYDYVVYVDADLSNTNSGATPDTTTYDPVTESGSGGSEIGFALLEDAESYIGSKSQSETVGIYLRRGQTWTYNTDSTSTWHFQIDNTDPETHISAFGTDSSARPIIDGLVSDHSTATYDGEDGRHRWFRIFDVRRSGSSIRNLEIKNCYGNAIFNYDAHNITYTGNHIHHFGMCAIETGSSHGGTGFTVAYNVIHDGQLLRKYDKRSYGWDAAVSLIRGIDGGGAPRDHHVHHNLIYDIAGEGINAPSSLVEWNIVGDCGSSKLDTVPHSYDFYDSVVRYNYTIQSSSTDFLVDSGSPDSVRIGDEDPGGDNTSGSFEVYGNVFINSKYGVRFWEIYSPFSDDPFQSVQVYNNVTIDPSGWGFWVADPEIVDDCDYYNNSSIIIDNQSAVHANTDSSSDLPHANWSITGNHFWTEGGSPSVPSAWQTGMDTSDPDLAGQSTVDWDGQSGPTYYKDINPATDINPPTSSPIYGWSPWLTQDINVFVSEIENYHLQ